MNNNIKENNDQELLRSFIGSSFDKIIQKPFNFSAFLFSTFYFFYRKMFIYGTLLYLIINLIMLCVINNVILIIIIVIMFRVIIGFFANKIYLFYAKRKIDKIKLKNEQKSLQEIKDICKDAGGTDFLNIFVGIFIEVGIILLITLFMIDKMNSIPLLQNIII